MNTVEYSNRHAITDLLIGRKVVKVSEDTLLLDNGTSLKIVPNEGCGGCGSGWYDISELNGCENCIFGIEFENVATDDYGDAYSYRIFVYAENQRIKLLQVDGDDGNGYYGTGYWIEVKGPN